MKILGFDLRSLFRAPVVTEEPVIPDPQTPMPVEYNETDTNCVVTDLWDENTGPQEPQPCESMHQMMYEKSAPEKCTVERDYDQVTEQDWQDFWMGGSENYQGGSEQIHK